MFDIIVFSHFYKPHVGGLEKYVENFSKNLPNKKILIITSKYLPNLEDTSTDENITIQRIDCKEIIKGKYYIPTLKGIKQIRKDIQENSAEIHTHTRFYLNNCIATYYSKKYHLKHYHFEHGSSFVKDGSLFVKACAWLFDHTLAFYTLKNSDLIFPVSESVRMFLENNYGNLKLGSTIYNSYDFSLDTFNKKERPQVLKLLFVGRIIRSKGVYELIDACTLMNKTNIPYTLTLIGDGSEMDNIKEIVKKNKLESNVVFKGMLPFDETQKEYNKYDILINPSYTEGLPTTVIEALGNGLMVIATDAGGTNEIIPKDKLIGLGNISGKSIRDWVVQIYRDWDKEQKDYEYIFNDARTKFNWKENIKKYEEQAKAI